MALALVAPALTGAEPPNKGSPESSPSNGEARVALLAQSHQSKSSDPRARAFVQSAGESQRATDPSTLSRRARQMGVTDLELQALDAILNYKGGPDAKSAILALEKILSAGAVGTDLGRAEVLRALLHVYEVLMNQPADARRDFKPLGSPRQILVPIVRHKIGPEETRVLDERIHLILYHAWISHIRGIEELLARLIESEHLAPALYDTLNMKMLETLRRSCRASAERDVAGQPVEITLSRSKSSDWPCIPHQLFRPLWDSPRATERHRNALYGALEDALIGENRNFAWADSCSVYVSWLRERKWITRDHIQRYFDRMFETADPKPGATDRIAYTLFPEVYEAGPHRKGSSAKPSRAKLKDWWRRGGREAEWTRSFAKPQRIRMFMLVDSGAADGSLALLTAETAIEAGVVAETSFDSPWGPFRFRIRVTPSVREEGILLSNFAISRDGTDSKLPWTARISAGAYARINQNFLYLGRQRSPAALLALFVEDADSPPELVPRDADSLIAKLGRELSPGVPVSSEFPGREDAFLPMPYRLTIARRYLDVVEEPEWPRARSMYGKFAQLARFACEHGDDNGRKALQKWIDRDWPQSNHMKQVLQECDRLLATVAASEGSSILFDILNDEGRKSEVLALLLKSEVVESLTESERTRLAGQVVQRLLRGQTDEAKQYTAIVVLRNLTGQSFGYSYFGQASSRRAALRDWKRWASKSTSQP